MLLRLLGALLLLLVAVATLLIWRAQPEPVDDARAQWMTDEDRLIEAAGQMWRIRESGPQDAPAIVLIHGFSHSLETWEPLADALEADYRILRFDLPGHGLSQVRVDQAYSVSDTVDQVAALLEEVGPLRPVLIGNSLGGLIAARYSAAYPDRVEGLVLISPGGYPNLGVGDDPAEVPPQVRFYLNAAPQAAVEAATASLYADPSRLTDAQLERIGAMMRIEGIGPALISRIEQFTLPDPNPFLREIADPTLILWGAQDRFIPPTHGPRFNAAIAQSELVLIDDAGHMAHAETPDQVLEHLVPFLEGIER